MKKNITEGLEVYTEVRYLPEHSNAMEHSFFFMYTITIENKSEYTVKLMSRHWNIFDSSGEKRIVEGEGVVGEQPLIEPGEKYIYSSGCGLTTEIGKMSGYYNMVRTADNKKIRVLIPEFHLIPPFRLN